MGRQATSLGSTPPGARWRVWKGSRVAWSLRCSAVQQGSRGGGTRARDTQGCAEGLACPCGEGGEGVSGSRENKGSPGKCPLPGPGECPYFLCYPETRGHGLPPAIALSLPTVTIRRVSVFPGNPLPLGEPVPPPSPVAGVSGGPWPRLSLSSPPVGVGISTRTLRSGSTDGSSKHGRHHGASCLPSPGAERDGAGRGL